MLKIAITEKEYYKAQSTFEGAIKNGLMCIKSPSNENELSNFIKENHIRHVIIGVEPYRNSLYSALKPGALIARFGVGVDNIDQTLASKHGLFCSNTPDALTNCVAEHAMALILSSARNITNMTEEFRNGNWQPQMGSELWEKNLTIIGAGKIGSRLAQIAKFGFQMNVTGLQNINSKNSNYKFKENYDKLELNFYDAVKNADYISIHLPYQRETHHFLNKEKIDLIPSKAWVINTARGGLIDEQALFDALSGKKIAGACLDVFESEPYIPRSPKKDLRALCNVILTPHVGSTTFEACQKMANICLKNILFLEKGMISEMNLLFK